MQRGKGLGLTRRIVDPAGNANYLLDDARPGLAAHARSLPAYAFLAGTDAYTAVTRNRRPSRRWRAYWTARSRVPRDQGPTPRCTAFGTLTALHCLAITHRPTPKVDPETFYQEIRTIDAAAGRLYPEGATTLAALQAAQHRRLIGSYWWAYALDTALDALVSTGAVIVGTNWYSSLYRRDAEGIVRIAPTAVVDGGHLYCLNGYDARRGLVRIAQTWGDGDYWLPDEDLDRLLREDGECASVRELPDSHP